jgi:hypothetical protein
VAATAGCPVGGGGACAKASGSAMRPAETARARRNETAKLGSVAPMPQVGQPMPRFAGRLRRGGGGSPQRGDSQAPPNRLTSSEGPLLEPTHQFVIVNLTTGHRVAQVAPRPLGS